MKKNILETLIGFIVIMTAVAFIVFVYQNASNSYKEKGDNYLLKAKFQSAEGIIKGSDIMIAGIAIGQVEDMTLDFETYEAVVTLSINKKINIPSDSRASIVSSGFIGSKFISIDPGSDETFLKNGDSIIYTNSALNLEGLIGKIMYSFGNKAAK
jgi:phospholipid/cholesterol/gamma-HCH transport system substrate-binding protein